MRSERAGAGRLPGRRGGLSLAAGPSGAGTLLLALALSLLAACGGEGAQSGEEDGDRAETTERYYVRLSPSADPRSVAERHGVEPIEVITEHATAFYASLTADQVESLRADSLVVSLSREIHQPGDSSPRRVGGPEPVPVDTGGA